MAAAMRIVTSFVTLCNYLVDEILGEELFVLRADHFYLTVASLILLIATLDEDLSVALVSNVFNGLHVLADHETDLLVRYADAVDEHARRISYEWVTLAN